MLPQIYRKLDYIENATVGSYIDTGLLASLDMKVVVDGMAFEGNTALFGSRTEPMSADCFTLQFLGGIQSALPCLGSVSGASLGIKVEPFHIS